MDKRMFEGIAVIVHFDELFEAEYKSRLYFAKIHVYN